MINQFKWFLFKATIHSFCNDNVSKKFVQRNNISFIEKFVENFGNLLPEKEKG